MTSEQPLRDTFRSMAPHRAQQIRDSYYKAVEGLRALADALEIAGAEMPESANVLLGEHLLAREALGVMRRSELGRVL